MKKTKIIATIGPTSSSPKIIDEMIRAGVDGFRLNFSHGDFKSFSDSVKTIRDISERLNKNIAILGDLQGPKIRVGKIKSGAVNLNPNKTVRIFNEEVEGDENGFSTSYKNFSKEVQTGERILIDEGLIKLRVIEKNKNSVLCKVIEGGLLKEKKGVIFPIQF